MDEELSKPNLLIIEDDPENQKLLKTFLKREFEVFICDSAEAFYEKLKENTYDIFLVDIALRGEKDGLQLISELRKSNTYSNAPILCISAHVFPQDRENAAKAGADKFLPRPIYNHDLLAELVSAYHEKKQQKYN